jgi:putative methionine-R-sulfoxide reductase with GAF domain
MVSLLLVASFTAFFLAILEPIIDIVSVAVNAVALNATFSLTIAWLGEYLVENVNLKYFIIKVVSGAFFGRVLLKVSEKLTEYRRVSINEIK